MTEPLDLSELVMTTIKGGGAVLGLIYAVRYLVGKLETLAIKRDEEHTARIKEITAGCAAEREACATELEDMKNRIRFLEEARSVKSETRENRILDLAENTAATLKILVNKTN